MAFTTLYGSYTGGIKIARNSKSSDPNYGNTKTTWVSGNLIFAILSVIYHWLNNCYIHRITEFTDTLNKQIKQFFKYLKRKIWIVIVAYMVGIHNFYKEEEKSPDEIILTIDDNEKQEDSSPKN